MPRFYVVLTMLVIGIVLTSFPAGAVAQVKLPAIFSNNLVLQRNAKIPVWGTAEPGNQITVKIHRQKKTTKADQTGKWRIDLAPMPAGGPYELVVVGSEMIKFTNVMIGEVWLCSGQSNMEMPMVSTWAKVNNFKDEVAAANYPDLRLFIVHRAKSTRPRTDVESEGWKICDSTSIKNFSATAYFFGRHLQQRLGVPVGLIQSAWGGTVVEAWTSSATLKTVPDMAGFIRMLETSPLDSIFDESAFAAKMAEWNRQLDELDAKSQEAGSRWNLPDFDDSTWPTMLLPNNWERAGLPTFDGIVKFRKVVQLPESFGKQNLHLNLGPIDDADVTYFNGVQIGATNIWNQHRHYRVPADLPKIGNNVIAVRVLDTGGGGGLYGKPETLNLLKDSTQAIPLAGEWRYQPGADLQKLPPRPVSPNTPNRPTVLYNAMIAPLVPYAIRGAIWYQGESNAGRAHQYRTLFPLLIKDWRARWGQGDFSFLFVQLANFQPVATEPVDDDWAELREAQTMALSLPNTGMAVTIDIGDANDIHPGNKQEVGDRLALNARHLVYGENIAYSGPIYQSMKIEGNRIRLIFDHAEGGLIIKGGDKLQGFAIAGDDRKFVWAEAEIDGKTVVVSSPQIVKPVAVRYAWASNPVCNLYNRAGLPASPFRTDSWPGITRDAHLNHVY
ncbi:MAG: sialate O-acetylesterase [candidate division KSB1 bacterium]|nr:sialate O-acetylesterase [candidate division KSB1 bacterium]MDZ7304025.1 sialate O-acetylesterase [candidate division KSB1 bacterium]MDZ7313265.1 sialate O-acetylesterase [candidate division KSB1 bacterium]